MIVSNLFGSDPNGDNHRQQPPSVKLPQADYEYRHFPASLVRMAVSDRLWERCGVTIRGTLTVRRSQELRLEAYFRRAKIMGVVCLCVIYF